MSIFDKLKNTAQQAVTTAVQSAGSKRETFTFAALPERLAEVLAVLRANRLEPKRLAFVKNKADGVPWLFLVEAQKNRKTGLRVEPDVLISAGAALYGR